jgi:hypothetical protein
VAFFNLFNIIIKKGKERNKDMLKKYLELLSKAVGSFKNLGKGNSWSDYFQTVGFEFLVLLIGIAIIVGIIVVLFGPYKGTKKIKQFIISKSKLPLLKNIIGDYDKKIENIIKNVDKCIDILEDKLNKNKYINKDYTDYTSLINIINDITDNFNELSLLAYDNTLSDKLLKITNYISISEKIEKEKLMKKICSLRHHLCKYYIGNKATLLFEKNGFGKNEFALNDTLSDFLNVYIKKNNNIDIDVRTLVNKKKRLTMSIVAVLGLFYIVYAMIVVPLIMMLF